MNVRGLGNVQNAQWKMALLEECGIFRTFKSDFKGNKMVGKLNKITKDGNNWRKYMEKCTINGGESMLI